MSRSWCRVKPANEQVLIPVQKSCPECGGAMRIRYTNRRAVVSLRGLVCLRLKIRRCEDQACGRYHQAWRPEAEGALALPQHEFDNGLEQFFGAQRHHERPAARRLGRRGPNLAQPGPARLGARPRRHAWPRSPPPTWPPSMWRLGGRPASA